MTAVVIDPGHGGSVRQGGSSPRPREQARALLLAQQVARALGPEVQVILTRAGDISVPLAARAALAREANAAVFLSLHGGRARETWVHARASGASRDLAGTLQRELAAEAGPDRGVKAADLAVLRPEAVGARTAACLLELHELDEEEDDREREDGGAREDGRGREDGGAREDGSAREDGRGREDGREREEGRWREPPAHERHERLERLARAIARAIHRYLHATRELVRLIAERGAGVDSDDGEAYPAIGNPRRARRIGGWAQDDVSPDYRHLADATAGMSSEFQLDAAALQTLCEWNAFDTTAGDTGVVLFGLRGCRLTDDAYDGSFVDSVALSEDLPDHRENHCVLGVWRRSGSDAGKVAAFRGSTLPNLGAMARYAGGGEACNLLLTGRYGYRVGGHRAAADRLHLEGVFVENEPRIVVLRSRDDTTYQTSDFFDLLNPGDNIHPSRDTTGETFSSEGCQTVRGGGDTAGHQAPHRSGPGWVDFRERAGLTRLTAPAAENGRAFPYVLLTGREARLASTGASAGGLRRLRQGSTGPAVIALQNALAAEPASRRYAGPIDGTMSGATVMAYVKRQQALEGGNADGIVTPAAATAMGFDLETGALLAAPAIAAGWAGTSWHASGTGASVSQRAVRN